MWLIALCTTVLVPLSWSTDCKELRLNGVNCADRSISALMPWKARVPCCERSQTLTPTSCWKDWRAVLVVHMKSRQGFLPHLRKVAAGALPLVGKQAAMSEMICMCLGPTYRHPHTSALPAWQHSPAASDSCIEKPTERPARKLAVKSSLQSDSSPACMESRASAMPQSSLLQCV